MSTPIIYLLDVGVLVGDGAEFQNKLDLINLTELLRTLNGVT